MLNGCESNLQFDDRNARDGLQAVGDQSAVVEPTQSVLQAVVKGSEHERTANQSLAVKDPREIGRGVRTVLPESGAFMGARKPAAGGTCGCTKPCFQQFAQERTALAGRVVVW